MCDREICFFSETDYLGRTHPSTGKISRLTLQNSLRMFPDLNKGYSYTLGVSNLKIYSSVKSYQPAKLFHDTKKIENFRLFSSFRRMSLEASIEYLRSFRNVPDVFLSRLFEFSSSKKEFEKVDFSMFA